MEISIQVGNHFVMVFSLKIFLTICEKKIVPVIKKNICKLEANMPEFAKVLKYIARTI